jgi:hypothetical protein
MEWKDLLELLNDRIVMQEITEVVETVLSKPKMDGQARAAVTPISDACHHWVREGKCSYGDKCRYVHQEASK